MALLEVGQQVGDWTVVGFIDEGGNGEVWEVADDEGRPAAMKVLRDRRAESVAYRRFHREIDTVRGLGDHPGVLPILDARLPDEPNRKDRAWYVMPLAQPLERALEGQPVHDVVAAVATLAEVLADLHEKGIGHRDIKPANLLWYEESPALGDFGLVYVPDAESLTEPGRVPGAFGYIADEVMQDPDNAQAEPADVFALAKVLWKLLTPGALYPPQGPLRADGGPSTLARSLTVARADALDRILEAATRAQAARIEMPYFAGELRAWLELPAPAGTPEGLEAVLAAARESMARSLAARDEAAGRKDAREAARAVLVHQADELFESVRTIDPTGAHVGAMAVGGLNRLIEQLPETGRPLYGPAFHYGIRVTRTGGVGRDDILIVAFCLQVSEEGPAEGVVTGLLLAGDEETNDSEFRLLPTRRAQAGVDFEAAAEQTVADAAAQLGPVLESFIERATRGASN
jgi:hypothetical protein